MCLVFSANIDQTLPPAHSYTTNRRTHLLYQDFIDRQKSIYAEFHVPGRRAMMTADQTVVDLPTVLAVVFRYDEETCRCLAETSESIVGVGNFVGYDELTIHTALNGSAVALEPKNIGADACSSDSIGQVGD